MTVLNIPIECLPSKVSPSLDLGRPFSLPVSVSLLPGRAPVILTTFRRHAYGYPVGARRNHSGENLTGDG